jgi:hypothetical protein
MSGFVANTPAAAEADIENVFWPAISPATLRDIFSIKQDVNPAKLSHLVTMAIITTNDELKAFTISQQESGISSSDALEDGTRLNHLYKHAIYSTVMVSVIDNSRDYDATASGREDTDDIEKAMDTQRTNAAIAIRSILGLSRSNVELI